MNKNLIRTDLTLFEFRVHSNYRYMAIGKIRLHFLYSSLLRVNQKIIWEISLQFFYLQDRQMIFLT